MILLFPFAHWFFLFCFHGRRECEEGYYCTVVSGLVVMMVVVVLGRNELFETIALHWENMNGAKERLVILLAKPWVSYCSQIW